MKRLIEQDNGVATVYHDLGDRVVVQNVQDVSAIVEANKRAYNDASGCKSEMVHIGRIPVVIMERWCKEDGINYMAKENMKALLRKLENPDNRMFKTHPGKFA